MQPIHWCRMPVLRQPHGENVLAAFKRIRHRCTTRKAGIQWGVRPRPAKVSSGQPGPSAHLHLLISAPMNASGVLSSRGEGKVLHADCRLGNNRGEEPAAAECRQSTPEPTPEKTSPVSRLCDMKGATEVRWSGATRRHRARKPSVRTPAAEEPAQLGCLGPSASHRGPRQEAGFSPVAESQARNIHDRGDRPRGSARFANVGSKRSCVLAARSGGMDVPRAHQLGGRPNGATRGLAGPWTSPPKAARGSNRSCRCQQEDRPVSPSSPSTPGRECRPRPAVSCRPVRYDEVTFSPSVSALCC